LQQDAQWIEKQCHFCSGLNIPNMFSETFLGEEREALGGTNENANVGNFK